VCGIQEGECNYSLIVQFLSPLFHVCAVACFHTPFVLLLMGDGRTNKMWCDISRISITIYGRS
jgi:hypothetical protein